MRKTCKICGREFEAVGSRKCCSWACSNENTRRLNAKGRTAWNAKRKSLEERKKAGRPADKWERHRAWREAQVRAAPERFACALDPRWL